MNTLITHWIALFGLPLKIITDRGSTFKNEKWEEFASKHNIKLAHTTAYHPQANGMVGRMHRTLKQSLTAANTRNWLTTLPWTLLQIRNAKSSDIPYSPAQSVFGGNTRQPMDEVAKTKAIEVGEFTEKHVNDAPHPPCPGKWHGTEKKKLPNMQKPPEYIYVRKPTKKPQRDRYIGPVKVQQWGNKTVTIIDEHNKQAVVSIDRTKPAKQYDGIFLFWDKTRDMSKLFNDD